MSAALGSIRPSGIGTVCPLDVGADQRGAGPLPSGRRRSGRIGVMSDVRIDVPRSSRIERVGVVGCGLMGSGIAEVCARAGLDVDRARDRRTRRPRPGRGRLVKSLDRGLNAGKLTEDARDAAIARLAFTTELADLADRDLVVEAVVEDESMKVAIFRELDRHVTADGAILASNTSSIPIMKLGTATAASRAGDRHPLLQSRAGAAAGRARHQPDDERRDRCSARAASPPTCSTSV